MTDESDRSTVTPPPKGSGVCRPQGVPRVEVRRVSISSVLHEFADLFDQTKNPGLVELPKHAGSPELTEVIQLIRLYAWTRLGKFLE